MRKVLVLNEENDKLLTAICDAAFKALGIQVLSTVNKLASQIQTESEASDPVPEIVA
jgi:hypothetical protein